MANKITVVGNLTKDPKTRTAGEYEVCSFGIADNFYSKGEKVQFFKVDVWGKQGKACQDHLSKGQSATIFGRLTLESFDGDKGEKVPVLVITADQVVFGAKSQSQGSSSNERGERSERSEPRERPVSTRRGAPSTGTEEDLPF